MKKFLGFIILLFSLTVFVIPQSSEAASNVATITIFSDGSGGSYGTHSWISVKNISKKNIYVGKIKVAPNKEVTVGTWGNKEQHKGVWYNLEAYFANNGAKKAYNKRVSFSKKISASQLEKANKKIKQSSNDTWSYTNNCSTFATEVWNAALPKEKLNPSSKLKRYVGIDTPEGLAKAIKKKKGYATKRAIQNVKDTEVTYYNTKKKKNTKANSTSLKGSGSSY
ncbi:hypothetical protein LAV79_00450 [Peribacillus butanolivorans]|uniref:hypothetical protein n=1 Tax=Peribacillus butanolivorans TaxID=421767 RepID=UPI0030C90DAB